jgi:hypothetical protein
VEQIGFNNLHFPVGHVAIFVWVGAFKQVSFGLSLDTVLMGFSLQVLQLERKAQQDLDNLD